ncbi:helicostatins [Pararge aegeria]|uniref:helicostatins n=1 Tax=Pararge aegeria TaxID=116150 RepID=UPI0019D0DD92|nr:helicostatins [Pararge aegeria]
MPRQRHRYESTMLYTTLVIILVIGAAVGVPEATRNDQVTHDRPDQLEAIQDPAPDDVVQMEKRSPHYDFGLGKRAYSYVSEYKRLPVYNFGLGKRSRPYSFGLGKRSIDVDQTEEFPNEMDQGSYDVFDQYDDTPAYEVKRARPYSFGLGKRLSQDEDPEEKRARTYDFGLGKRPHMYNFGLGKRARNYNFGLGKRLVSKFNFGLGKRQRDLHRFSFGLGKRSVDMTYDENDNYLDV